LWDFSLVDPDNGRPVDFALRRLLLAGLESMSPEQIAERSNEGVPKLWTIHQCLRTRNTQPGSFGARGRYQPLWATGPKADHIVAFQRGENVITVAPRLLMSVGTWDATVLEVPDGSWRNQFTGDVVEGGKLEVGALLRRFPVGLLTKEGAA
jgi:(1->4)-alpha-D-glucan 1-alpha-D-glucosylmutase